MVYHKSNVIVVAKIEILTARGFKEKLKVPNMIDEALEFIRKKLDDFLDTRGPVEVVLGNIAKLHADNETANKIILSLVNVEEEATMKNKKHYREVNDKIFFQEPPLFINTYLLISFCLSDYKTNIANLSFVLEFFQNKDVYRSQDEPELAANGLERLIFDLITLNFEQINHLWGTMGGAFYPFVLYKIRLTKIQRITEDLEIPAIRETDFDSLVKN